MVLKILKWILYVSMLGGLDFKGNEFFVGFFGFCLSSNYK